MYAPPWLVAGRVDLFTLTGSILMMTGAQSGPLEELYAMCPVDLSRSDRARTSASEWISRLPQIRRRLAERT